MTHVADLARDIRLLALDVDGVLTDGRLYYSADGEALKVFNTLDGHGIKMLQASGVEVAVITGRNSPAMARRVRDLGIQHLYAGREDKLIALRELWQTTGFSAETTAYMGDDWPDLPAIRQCHLGATVPNACDAVLKHADWCSEREGGLGAVRELCELIMYAQETLDAQLAPYLAEGQ
ncbi:KdsC family phosphatase [Motiliproteus sediminis]|uniref:KdsC family phosphatase n=1 Tax=Motiliproteus sediminis TaxID=1468178 RepID=UPI001AEFD9DD|nr:HAD hydrolase family protein [Motiliproteus sediminis]